MPNSKYGLPGSEKQQPAAADLSRAEIDRIMKTDRPAAAKDHGANPFATR